MPFPIGGGRAARAVPSFVGAQTYTNPANPQAVTWPTGTAAGDLALIGGSQWSGGAPTGLSGWTTRTDTAGLSNVFLAFKKLTSSDIATPPSIGNSGADGTLDVIVFRGPVGASVKQYTTGTGATLSTSAYAPAGNGMGSYAWSCDRDPTSTFGLPGGWIAATTAHAGTNFSSRGAYNPYHYGEATTWTGYATALGDEAIYMVELTG